MSRLFMFVAILFFVVLAGGVLFLAGWDIPAPSAVVEKTIPDARFPR